jgi:hypothetical protein
MERSNFFLGVTASLLAIVGFVAAKEKRAFSIKPYYKLTSTDCTLYKLNVAY